MVPIVVLFGVFVSDGSTNSTVRETRSLNARIQSMNRILVDGLTRSELQNQQLEKLVKQLQQAGFTGQATDDLKRQCQDSRKLLELLKKTPIKEIEQKK